MKTKLVILGVGLALMAFGCSDDTSETGTGGTAGMGGSGGSAGSGGMAGGGGEGGEGGMGGTPAQSGSTTWSAITTPPGGGTNPGVTGGCEVAVTALGGTVVALETSITLDVASDEAYNVTTAWEILVNNPLLGAIGNAAELGSLDINAVVTGATGGPINSGLTAGATGGLIGDFYEVPSVGPLVIASPDAIVEGAAALTPDGGAGSTFNVNWDGLFTLDLTLGGNPLLTVDESICTFTDEGTGVDITVN